ncbi:MAG TPA: SHOCT domain-containing protein [Solirubrobacteraceae bacterium]|nr:SHOCT domain-containing protein [Solirubrobacteraceae bacterium]
MVRAYVGSFLSLAGLACGLTWLYLGMRSVMEIGGACAEGGPYVIAQPCPDGVPFFMVGGIFGGLICVGLFVWASSGLGGSYGTLAAFAWPALFLSLGWNFAEFAVDPPGEEQGLVWGWLICAVVFFAMGGLPLLGLARPSNLKKMLWPADPDPFAAVAAPVVPIGRAFGESLTLASPGVSQDGDVVAQLERLAALRDRGALDPDEYEQAKKAVLDG